MAKTIFKTNSILGFLTAFSAVAVFIGITMQEIQPDISQQILSVFQPILTLSIIIWMIYVGMSIYRNLKKI